MATAMDAADAAFAAIQLNDDLDEAEVRRRAYEMERRADEQWRSMHTEQRRRNEEAELKARRASEELARSVAMLQKSDEALRQVRTDAERSLLNAQMRAREEAEEVPAS